MTKKAPPSLDIILSNCDPDMKYKRYLAAHQTVAYLLRLKPFKHVKDYTFSLHYEVAWDNYQTLLSAHQDFTSIVTSRLQAHAQGPAAFHLDSSPADNDTLYGYFCLKVRLAPRLKLSLEEQTLFTQWDRAWKTSKGR